MLGAAVMSGAVPRSAVEVFRDSAVRFFLAVIGPVAASVLSVERGNPRVLRVAAPATDGAAGIAAHAAAPAAECVSVDKKSRRLTCAGRATDFGFMGTARILARTFHQSQRRHQPGRDIALRCPDGAARRPYQTAATSMSTSKKKE